MNTEASWARLLGMVKDFEITVLQVLNNLQQDIGDLKRELSGVRRDTTGIKKDISAVKQDIGQIKLKASKLSKDMITVKKDVTELKFDTHRLEVLHEETDDQVALIVDGFAPTVQKVVEHDIRIARIERAT